MITETLEQKNEKAFGKVGLAQQILNKIRFHPELFDVHDPLLSKLGISRWNRHFIMDNVKEFNEMYNTVLPYRIPEQIQSFVKDANSFLYGGAH
jgi:hypothetical protein